MATLARTPVFNRVQIHPTLIYLAETSRGIPKVLQAEVTLPRGINKLLQGIAAPPYVRNVVDTTWDSFKPLLVELVTPAGTNKLVSETRLPDLPRILNYPSSGTFPGYLSVLVQPPFRPILFPTVDRPREIYGESGSSLIDVPANTPFISINELPLIRYLFNVVDTSKGIAKTLQTETTLPIGKSDVVMAPSYIRNVTDTSKGFVFAPPSPFIPGPHLVPVKFWFQPEDTTEGMAKTLTNDATPPLTRNNFSVSLVDSPRVIYNFIYNNFEVLTFVAPPATTSFTSGMLAARHVRRRIHGNRR